MCAQAAQMVKDEASGRELTAQTMQMQITLVQALSKAAVMETGHTCGAMLRWLLRQCVLVQYNVVLTQNMHHLQQSCEGFIRVM